VTPCAWQTTYLLRYVACLCRMSSSCSWSRGKGGGRFDLGELVVGSISTNNRESGSESCATKQVEYLNRVPDLKIN
jgi:hypothetical protein